MEPQIMTETNAENDTLLAVAKLIFESEMTINEFYEVLGINLEDVGRSDPHEKVTRLAGIFDGWNNPIK